MIFRERETIDKTKNLIATYSVKSLTNIATAALEIAIGQSVGNPHVRNKWEDDALFENHSCKVIGNEEELSQYKEGIVDIAFPIINTDWKTDGISHLLCQLMGGQVDIKDIIYCRLLKVQFPEAVLAELQYAPKYGLTGMRRLTNTPDDKPLVGGIVKPKTGLTPEILLEVVKEMVEGGVNFIKEDEILSNCPTCPIHIRVPLIMDYIRSCGRHVFYAVCINADPEHILDRVKQVHVLGGNAIHVNFWCGLGVYRSIRSLDLPLLMHYQQSGSKILTDPQAKYSIDFDVLCQLASICGVDTMHIGNLFGYSSETEEEIKTYINTLAKYNVVPALSCGMHPGIVNAVTATIGPNYLANSGGAIHGHPQGTLAGVKAMCQAINGDHTAPEYQDAIAKWGKM